MSTAAAALVYPQGGTAGGALAGSLVWALAGTAVSALRCTPPGVRY